MIGGDFNADEALDEKQRNRAHHLFFERLKDFGFYLKVYRTSIFSNFKKFESKKKLSINKKKLRLFIK